MECSYQPGPSNSITRLRCNYECCSCTRHTCDLSLVRISLSRVSSSSFFFSLSTSLPLDSRSASRPAMVCFRMSRSFSTCMTWHRTRSHMCILDSERVSYSEALLRCYRCNMHMFFKMSPPVVLMVHGQAYFTAETLSKTHSTSKKFKHHAYCGHVIFLMHRQ